MRLEFFNLKDLPILWEWMLQFPENNFTEDGPKTYEEFVFHINNQLDDGSLYAVYTDVLVGAIGIKLVGQDAWFWGICFDKSVHGTGVAHEAVTKIIKVLRAKGIKNIYARYLVTNLQVDKFFVKLGAVHEFKQVVIKGK